MSKNLLIFFFIFTFLFIISKSYSIEGQWKLKSAYLPTNTTQDLLFDFYRQIQNNGTQIKYYLNIFSCKLIRYKYLIIDNQIFFQFVQNVADRYNCQSNEIRQIRNTLEIIFYFYIIGNQLSLYGPSQSVQAQFTRLSKPAPQSFIGSWTTLIVQQDPINKPLIATQTQFQFCNGQGIVKYQFPDPKTNQVNFKIFKTSNCQQNEIYTALFRTAFYRLKNNLVYFLDTSYNQIMMMSKLALLGAEASIKNNLGSNNQVLQASNMSEKSVIVHSIPSISTQDSIITQNKNILSINSNSQKKNQSVAVSSAPFNQNQQIQINDSSLVFKISAETQIKPESNIKPISSILGPNSNSNSGSTKLNYSNDSLINNTIVISNTSSQLSSPMISQINFTQIKSQQILGKYLIQQSSFDYSSAGYFFIILPSRILLYGDCNVYYSFYNLNQSNNIFQNIKIQNTLKQCPQLKKQSKDLIERFKQWKYITKIITMNKQGSKKKIRLYNGEMKFLMSLVEV